MTMFSKPNGWRPSILATSTLCATLSCNALAQQVTMEAESFVASGGTYPDGNANPVNIYSVNGGQGINFINSGDYVEYDVNIPTAGIYSVAYQAGTSVASGTEISIFTMENGSLQNQGGASVPALGWDNFQTVAAPNNVTLESGVQRVRVEATGSNAWQWNMDSFAFDLVSATGGGDNGSDNGGGDNGGGSPVVLTIEAENFNSISGTFADGQPNPITVYTAGNGESGINWVNRGDAADYIVNVPEAGTYTLTYNIGTVITNGAEIELLVNGASQGTTTVPSTNGWDNFQDLSASHSVALAAGSQTLRIYASGSNDWQWNLNRFTLEKSGNTGGGGGPVDSDGDGVVDGSDTCPNTPSGASVDGNGCAASQLDGDNDGVNNNVDQCPNTPAGTQVDSVGCALPPPDSDNDGVEDGIDQCPNTPSGTQVDNVGCALPPADSDGDGVNDDQDQCPNTPAGTAVMANGCPVIVGDNGPGLLYGEVDGPMNTSDANPNWIVDLDLEELDGAIGGNTTEIYTGFINDADGNISFYEHIDDSVRLYIDGTLVLSNDSWENSSSTGNLNLSPGTHAFELRIGNADGGSGPVDAIGFGIDVNGGNNFVAASSIASSIFAYQGTPTGDPRIPPAGGIVIELEDFDATGTVGRVASDSIDGFNSTGTSVNFVTNGDWGDYYNVFLEAGTYRSFIKAEGGGGSYGARIELDGWPVAWGYFGATNGSEEIELYGGDFVVEADGNYTLRVQAIGGSDWQWTGDNIRLAKVSDDSVRPAPLYNPNDHFVSEIQGPATGLQYLKAPVAIPTANQLLASDVWYTYAQNNELEGYSVAETGATGSFWGHPPEEHFYDDTVIMDWVANVEDWQALGIEYTARGEFDWGFRWVTEYLTNPEPHYVKTLDDRNVRMTFMGYHSYNGYNNNWLSNHSPAFVPHMKSQVDQILRSNPDKLLFDTQTNSTRTTDLRTFGGDFSEYAMENFRVWLSKKYSTAELAAMGVGDINSFDYGEFLIARGISHTDWSNAGNTISGNIPMLEDFIYFNRDVWNQKFGEVLEYIRQQRPGIEIGASTQLFESRGYLFNENITFLGNELFLDIDPSFSELPTNIVAQYKAAGAVGKPLALFPYPSEFNSLRTNDAARFGRGWIAQAYAYGGLFSIPAAVWVGDSSLPFETWNVPPETYLDIYRFVRDNETLFDNYTSYSKVGLVHAMYSSMKANLLNGGNQVLSSTRILTQDNINFDLLVFGDEGYQVVPRSADFDKFDHIFFDGDLNLLTTEQRAVLDQQGSKVRHIGQRGTLDGIAIEVSINGASSNETVTTVTRVHETNANAPYVMHLINRPFAGGVTPILNGVEIAIPADYFPESVTSATLHLPDGSHSNVIVSTNADGDKVVTVDNLEVWGILELDH